MKATICAPAPWLLLVTVVTVPRSDLLSVISHSRKTTGLPRVTNRDLATIMVADSDDSARNVLIDHVAMANIERTLASLGLKNTHLQRKLMDIEAARQRRENISTPREMMTLRDAIYRDKLLHKNSLRISSRYFHAKKDSSIPQASSARFSNRRQTRRARGCTQRLRHRLRPQSALRALCGDDISSG
jgi:beta-lactamase class A